jgi:TAG lipase / lysophosphatidylethanolamine acyltransferase
MPTDIIGAKLWSFLAAIFGVILDVVQFWNHVRLFNSSFSFDCMQLLTDTCGTKRWVLWWRSRSPQDQLSHSLASADTFEEWEKAAFRLDELLSGDLW